MWFAFLLAPPWLNSLTTSGPPRNCRTFANSWESPGTGGIQILRLSLSTRPKLARRDCVRIHDENARSGFEAVPQIFRRFCQGFTIWLVAHLIQTSLEEITLNKDPHSVAFWPALPAYCYRMPAGSRSSRWKHSLTCHSPLPNNRLSVQSLGWKVNLQKSACAWVNSSEIKEWWKWVMIDKEEEDLEGFISTRSKLTHILIQLFNPQPSSLGS